MSDSEHTQRTVKRNLSTIPVLVTRRESADYYWKEETEIVSVSKLGGGFDLSKEVPVGRLLFLRMEMPQIYRCYDYDKRFYEIWAVVQYCNLIRVNEKITFQIGVAFVGKAPPKSYYQQPFTKYSISGLDENGFWRLMEEKASYVSRLYPRYEYSLLAKLIKMDDDGEESETDQYARTKDISEGGTAIYTTIEANVGDYIDFACDDPEFSSMCIVRNRQTAENDRMTLHLSFSEEKFPIKELGSDLKEI